MSTVLYVCGGTVLVRAAEALRQHETKFYDLMRQTWCHIISAYAQLLSPSCLEEANKCLPSQELLLARCVFLFVMKCAFFNMRAPVESNMYDCDCTVQAVGGRVLSVLSTTHGTSSKLGYVNTHTPTHAWNVPVLIHTLFIHWMLRFDWELTPLLCFVAFKENTRRF